MAITFEDWSAGGVIIDDDEPYEDDVRIGGILLLDETEAIQVRDELLRRYPLEKAEGAAKPEGRVLGDGSHGALVGGGPAKGYIYYEFGHPFIGSGGTCAAPVEADEASKQGGHEPASPVGVFQHVHADENPSEDDLWPKEWPKSRLDEIAAAIDAEKLPVDLDAEMFENDQLRKQVVALEAKIRRLESALKALIGE